MNKCWVIYSLYEKVQSRNLIGYIVQEIPFKDEQTTEKFINKTMYNMSNNFNCGISYNFYNCYEILIHAVEKHDFLKQYDNLIVDKVFDFIWNCPSKKMADSLRKNIESFYILSRGYL